MQIKQYIFYIKCINIFIVKVFVSICSTTKIMIYIFYSESETVEKNKRKALHYVSKTLWRYAGKGKLWRVLIGFIL